MQKTYTKLPWELKKRTTTHKYKYKKNYLDYPLKTKLHFLTSTKKRGHQGSLEWWKQSWFCHNCHDRHQIYRDFIYLYIFIYLFCFFRVFSCVSNHGSLREGWWGGRWRWELRGGGWCWKDPAGLPLTDRGGDWGETSCCCWSCWSWRWWWTW